MDSQRINSITMDQLIAHIDNPMWYVSRTGTVKQLDMTIDNLNTNQFCRFHDVDVIETVLNNSNVIKSEWYGDEGSGWMYDHYFKYGHIFFEKSKAFKYLKKRIDAHKTKGVVLVQTAIQLYNKYPEYHL